MDSVGHRCKIISLMWMEILFRLTSSIQSRPMDRCRHSNHSSRSLAVCSSPHSHNSCFLVGRRDHSNRCSGESQYLNETSKSSETDNLFVDAAVTAASGIQWTASSTIYCPSVIVLPFHSLPKHTAGTISGIARQLPKAELSRQKEAVQRF